MTGRPDGLDLRLLPAAGAAWLAAWCGVLAQVGVAVTVAGGCLVGCLVLCAAGRQRRPMQAATAALVLASAGAVLAASAGVSSARQAGPLPDWAEARLSVVLDGRLSGDPRRLPAGRFGQTERYLVGLSADGGVVRGRRYRLDAPVTVLGGPGWGSTWAGQRVTVTGRAQPVTGQDAAAFLVARGPPTIRDGGRWPWLVAQRLRVGLQRACRPLPPDAGGLLPALVVGDTSRVPDDLRAALRAAGLTHLTAVSGANVAIVCGAALGLAALLGARRRVRLVLAAAALVGFIVLARPEPSVLRAGVMGAVGLIGLAAARSPAGVPALAGAVIVLLAVDPWLARSYGFVLSVLATGGLLLLAPAWVQRLERRMPRLSAVLLAAPAAAFAVTAPVTALLQPTVSLVAIPANLAAAPAVAPATVLGVLAALASVPVPAVATLLAGAGGLGTAWIALVAHRSAGVPGGSLPWLPGPLGAVLLAVLVLGLVVATVLFRATRPVRLLPGTVLVGVLLAAAGGWHVGPHLRGDQGGWPPPDWQVVMCDVGQGDAMVLRSGARSAVLVDAGPEPEPVDRCLRRLDVRRLDLVVLTHAHVDHVGGLAGALRGRGRPVTLTSPLARPADTAVAVGRQLQAVAARQQPAAAGMSGTAGEAAAPVHWQVLWPRPPVQDMEHDTIDNEQINDASLVVLFRTAGLSVLALGDVELTAQRALLATVAGWAPVDVVKVAHHGSASQVAPLYARLSARVALVGVGAGNDYGHPAPRTLAMLRAAGAVVARTDLHGDVAVHRSGDRLAVLVNRTEPVARAALGSSPPPRRLADPITVARAARGPPFALATVTWRSAPSSGKGGWKAHAGAGPQSYVWSPRRGHYDEPARLAALATPAAHVGLVASQKRAASVLQWLAEQGADGEHLAPGRGPGGAGPRPDRARRDHGLAARRDRGLAARRAGGVPVLRGRTAPRGSRRCPSRPSTRSAGWRSTWPPPGSAAAPATTWCTSAPRAASVPTRRTRPGTPPAARGDR